MGLDISEWGDIMDNKMSPKAKKYHFAGSMERAYMDLQEEFKKLKQENITLREELNKKPR